MEIKAKEITLFPSVKLSEYPKNVNVHTEEQIDKIIQLIDFYGHRDPLIVDADIQPDGTHWVLAGNGRLLSARKAKWENLPVIFQKFNSEEEKYGFMVSHNAVSSSGWGGGLDLAKINTDIIDLGPDFDIEMLAIKDFVIEPIEKFEPQSDEDEVPEVVHPITRKGDIWILGNHRLMCGDSTMIDDVERLMNGEKADMVFTDPPYNVASDSVNFASKVSKSMNDLKNSEWDKGFEIEPPIINAVSFSKDSATYYVWTNHYLFNRIMETLKEFCDFTGYLVWSKPNPQPSLAKRHPTWNTELCVYATRGTKRIVNFPDGKHFLSCREVKRLHHSQWEGHVAQKPLELIEPLIEFSSNKNQLILDLFLGSGSTLIASEKTNRKCYGMELDEKYCDVIINRWQNYTNKKAVLESTNQTYEELKQERGE